MGTRTEARLMCMDEKVDDMFRLHALFSMKLCVGASLLLCTYVLTFVI